MLVTLATIFAIATALYSAVWMHHVRQSASTLFGAYPDYSPSARSLQILSVDGDSPAARAGLQPGDRIVAINQRPLDTLVPYYDAISRGVPGDVLTLDVERYCNGENQDRGRRQREVPAMSPGGRDQRRVRLAGGTMRRGEDVLIELARGLLAGQLAIVLGDFRVAFVSHRLPPP